MDGWMEVTLNQDLRFDVPFLIVWWGGGNADGVYKRGDFDFDFDFLI